MSALTEALTPLVDEGEVAGLVAVVARDDDVDVTVLGEQTLGGPPMREDSLFRIASAGKPITAAAALTLVADGVLTLDQPVDELLPELADPRVLRHPSGPLDDTVPANRSISVRDLLRSTNGLGFATDFDAPIAAALLERLHQAAPPHEVQPPDEWLAAAGELPLIHQPGEGFTYNLAYDLLGALVGRATGRPFDVYVDERILRPLGMADTGFSFPADDLDRATTAYRRDHGVLVDTDPPDGDFARPAAFASGAGGYVSTAPDLLRFARLLLDGGGDVLPERWVTEMTSDQLTPAIRATDMHFLDGQTWGYGGGVDIVVRHPWNVLGRYGWVGGTGPAFHVVPADGSVAILLIQTEMLGPADGRTLEKFWAAAAAHLGHGHDGRR